jgi:hypothetical protein
LGAIALALAPGAIGAAQSPATPVPPTRMVGASVTPTELGYGDQVTVTGRLTEVGQSVAGAPLVLRAAPFPFRAYATIATTTTSSDGSFSFSGVRPSRNTRMLVLATSGSITITSPVLEVVVDPVATLAARSLGPGLERLSLRLRHTPYGRLAPVPAWWFVAPRGARVFHLAATTDTRELSPDTTYASVTLDPPSRRFSYRVCLNPPWEQAMGTPATHGPCPTHDFSARGDAG